MFTGGKRTECSTRSFIFSFLEMAVGNKERLPQNVFYSFGDETLELDWFFWPTWLVCSEGLPAGIGCWNNGRSLEWKVGGDLCSPFGMGSVGKGRLKQVFCYRAGDENRNTGTGGARG